MPSKRDSSLSPAIDSERSDVPASTGKIAVYRDNDKQGRPLLLLHSINAAPSAMEIKPLFEHYREQRPVFAPDLPGFGLSSRPDLLYTPKLYADAILLILKELDLSGADVIALSTTSEFAAMAASQSPELFNSLTIVSPTGLGNRNPPTERTSDTIRGVFRTPFLAEGVFRLLTSKASIRFFLNQSFQGSAPEEMIDYAYATSHQSGAHFAPYCFLSGRLFTRSACELFYEQLTVPTLVLYDRDANISFEKLPQLLERNTVCESARISPTMGLPHWEKLPETVAAIDQFWSQSH
ncbi:MAG: alpha/beta hydrolase [Pseudomonadota bacterium]